MIKLAEKYSIVRWSFSYQQISECFMLAKLKAVPSQTKKQGGGWNCRKNPCTRQNKKTCQRLHQKEKKQPWGKNSFIPFLNIEEEIIPTDKIQNRNNSSRQKRCKMHTYVGAWWYLKSNKVVQIFKSHRILLQPSQYFWMKIFFNEEVLASGQFNWYKHSNC